jgi:histidinol-phosphate aminotransferase
MSLTAPALHTPVEHGGPDGGPPIRWDFSTNANPLPQPPALLAALAQADRTRYPDPHYRALRHTLAPAWSLDPARVLPTAGSSEAIRRLTLAARLQGLTTVWLPEPGYGDYRAAAEALGLAVRSYANGESLLSGLVQARSAAHVALVWLNEPCNPTGASLPAPFWQTLHRLVADGACVVGLDRAYEPLRLQGRDPIPAETAALCWQLWSPNKALGLTGVRAGVVVAPDTARGLVQQAMHSLAPSWVLSAEGVALLQAWCGPETQAWLAHSRRTLRTWMHAQRTLLSALGWVHQASCTPFGLSRPAALGPADMALALAHLRTQGIRLRDTTSMGLTGWWRLATLSPAAQADLAAAWLSCPVAAPRAPLFAPQEASA